MSDAPDTLSGRGGVFRPIYFMEIEIIKDKGENERQIWTFSADEKGIRLLNFTVKTKSSSLWTWERNHSCFHETRTVWGAFLDPAFGKPQPDIPADIQRRVRRKLSDWARSAAFLTRTPNVYRKPKLIKIGGLV